MVKLDFNPKNQNEKEICLKSKTSKKSEIVISQKNFNPFSETLNNFEYIIETETLKCSDLIGLENCYYILKKWFYEPFKDILLLVGPTGCGKTSLIDLFCKEENIKLLNINIFKSKKDVLKDIDIFIEYSSDFFFRNKCKKIILIDEYQNGQNDIFSIPDIITLKEKNIHILIISSDSKGSKLNELKKNNNVYYINEIPPSLLKPWIISLNKVSLNNIQINYIIKKCKSDKRFIINTLEFIINSKNTNLDLFLQNYYKDVDINLFEYTKKIFDNLEPVSISELFNIYDNDGFILSNLVHENYLDYNQDIDLIAKTADALSYGEILFSDTYDTNKTFLPKAHCINSLIIPSYYSRCDVPNKNQIRCSVINNRFNILLNNKKIILKINNLKNTFNIYDIYYIKSILTQELIKSKIPNINKIEFIKKILISLDNNMERLELIYKHFNDFKEHAIKETKTKNFTLKFKEKIKLTLNGEFINFNP